MWLSCVSARPQLHVWGLFRYTEMAGRTIPPVLERRSGQTDLRLRVTTVKWLSVSSVNGFGNAVVPGRIGRLAPRTVSAVSACLTRSSMYACSFPLFARTADGQLYPLGQHPASPVQMAPSASQSVVAFRAMATSALESGVTVTSQRTLPGRSSRRT